MATIDDVAKAAGVSTSTVSYVLSGKRPISGPTRARVEKAIRDLGYRPHAGARALASSRTNVIALVAPLRVAVNVNVIMEFVTGVVTAARHHNYDVLLLTQEDATGIDRVSSGSMVDAIIAMDIEEDDPRIPLLKAARQPAVLIGLPRDNAGLSCVDLDFFGAGAATVRHLAHLGHTNVGMLGAPHAVWQRHTSFWDRTLSGAHYEATSKGVTFTAIPCEASEVGARQGVTELLRKAPGITGLVVHNEAALPHVVAALRDSGRSIPEDISVVAICPQHLATSQPQALTSVTIPATAIGKVAVDMAMQRLSDPEQPAETRLLAAELTQRATTAQQSTALNTATGDTASIGLM